MAYYGLVTQIENIRKAPNSDNLYIGECFGENVIVNSNLFNGAWVLYLPADGQIERWFGEQFSLFRKNKDGTSQGGYLDDNGHIRAIKLRGNKSEGIVIPLNDVYNFFGDQDWNLSDRVNTINGKEFCRKYIPPIKKTQARTPKTSYKGRKINGITYPEFEMHKDTEQLAYNLDDFKPGDIVNLSLKMHGTSSRHARTTAVYKNGFFRKLFHLKPKTKSAYVCGSRRCVIDENSEGFYGDNTFRLKHHKALEPFVEEGQCIYGEIVGYYGPDENNTIMPIGDNTKVNDKAFVKEFGKRSIFNYGCEVGESKLYIYRITSNNGEKEWTPQEITEWCDKNGLLHVPYISTFEFTSKEDLLERINKYFEDLHDPVGKTHIKEGVVVRILNRPTWKAYKIKTMEFKILSGITSDAVDASNISEDLLSEI